jgi:hypothetical protein
LGGGGGSLAEGVAHEDITAKKSKHKHWIHTYAGNPTLLLHIMFVLSLII